MNALHQLQQNMQAHLLTGDMAIAASIVATPEVPVATRLGIYHDAYRFRLLEALSSNYPCLERQAGSDRFRQWGLAYIAQYPSKTRSIRWYGENMAAFLTQEPGYLAEMADFEWHLSLAFDAADADVLTIEDMTALPPDAWPDLRFMAHPSLQRVTYFWNVVPMWQAMAENREAVDAHKGDQATAWVVWRKDHLNRFYSLTEEEAWALDAMIAHVNFADICDGLCQWQTAKTVGMRAAGLLKGWLKSGLIQGIHPS